MKKIITKAFFALLVIAAPQLAGEARACSCFAVPTPYRAYSQARVVFAGKVLTSRDTMSDERQFRFAVEESFKGAGAAEIEVSVGLIRSSCFSGFEIGKRYLVYAYGDTGGPLYTSMCSRTNDFGWARDDVHFIRALLKGQPEPRIYGSVARVDTDFTKSQSSLLTPLEGIKVLIKGEGRTFEAVSDKQGRFSLNGIPDGKYKAKLLLPDKYMIYFPAEEEFVLGPLEEPPTDPRVHQGPSAYAQFRVGWNNGLSGKILDAEGNPIWRARAALLSIGSSTNSPLVIKESPHNNAEGKYHFSGLSSGKYLPVVTVEAPFKTGVCEKRFYYPGVVSLNQASEIEVKESGDVTGKDIKLPPGYAVRPVEGVLVWPDGSPVAKAWVILAEKKTSGDENKKYDWRDADERGRFSVQGFVGAEYWVHVSVMTLSVKLSTGRSLWDSGFKELNVPPVKVTVGAANEPLRIVVPLPEGVGKVVPE